MSARWHVERPGKGYNTEDVGAANCEVNGGCLVFRDENGEIVLAYSAAAWLTVTDEGAE